jgi:hypothetical protein
VSTGETRRVIADGEWAVAGWTSHARVCSGTPYDNDYAAVFHVTDGRTGAVTGYCGTSCVKRVLFDLGLPPCESAGRSVPGRTPMRERAERPPRSRGRLR